MNNTSTISFKRHIPLINCQIKKRKSNENIPVTFFELDCTELQDIYDIEVLPDNRFSFIMAIILNMCEKYKYLGYNELSDDKYSLSTALMNARSINNISDKNSRFYVLESPQTAITAICQTHDEDGKMSIDYISSRRNGLYKYAGQTMVACCTKQAFKNNSEGIIINNPAKAALEFYTEKCGFEHIKDNENLYMDKSKIKGLLENTQKKTKSSIDFIS